jgi:two-component system response regulator YesN
LIAEDEDKIREGIAGHIRANSSCFDEILLASNGQAAIDLIFRARPQIMLLDIQMPVKDGLEVMREATQAGACPRTVILSGHSDFAYAQQALRYGAVDYLLKPCRAAEILARLLELAREIAPEAAEEVREAQEAQGNAFVRKAVAYMERHYQEDISLSAVAEAIGLSPNYLSTLFTRTQKARFVDQLNKIRIERACDYFQDAGNRTGEVAYKVGFRDEKYFSNVFKKLTGLSPSEYKKKATDRKNP